eukprot:XP_799955.3 PREDICTED: uncharacterized protein LOC577369 isoform X1 [Strongylocentrotus purpuratus]
MGASSSVHKHKKDKGRISPNTPKSGDPIDGSNHRQECVVEDIPQKRNQDGENQEVTTKSKSTSPQVEGPSAQDSQVGMERQTERSSSMEPKDLMISYSHQDRDKMRMMIDALEKAGISVWVDETGLKAGVEFLNKIGQAIIDAKLFLSLLSTRSATSKYCKDELALAYVSSKPIYPCMIQPHKQVTEVMDFGMRLQLAPIRWFDFSDEDDFQGSFDKLATCIKQKLAEITDEANRTEGSAKKHKQITRKETRTRLNVHQILPPTEAIMKDFWAVHFKNKETVPLEEFMSAFKNDCTEELSKIGVTLEWIIPVLKEELDEERDDIITKESYEYFCTIDEERLDFWDRVKEQALERYTMLEVFSMDSTVRIDAIQNLAKFHTRSVMEAMMDLCADKDDNVRAVASLSLARVADGKNLRVIRRLLRLLKDRDRLVRQSCCLALGHMRAKQAIPSLVQLWRNDAISNVREAAHIALEKIGGDEAQEAIHITKVLSAEIKALAQQK